MCGSRAPAWSPPCRPSLCSPVGGPSRFPHPVSSRFHMQVIIITHPHPLLIFWRHLLDKARFSADILFLLKAKHLSSQYRKPVVKVEGRKWKKGPPTSETVPPGSARRCLCQPRMELCIMNKNCCQHALVSKHWSIWYVIICIVKRNKVNLDIIKNVIF